MLYGIQTSVIMREATTASASAVRSVATAVEKNDVFAGKALYSKAPSGVNSLINFIKEHTVVRFQNYITKRNIPKFSEALNQEAKSGFKASLEEIKQVLPEEFQAVLMGRPKHTDSISSKLARKHKEGTRIADVDAARALVGDLKAYKLPLDDTLLKSTDKLVRSMAKAIQSGDLTITKLENYRGVGSKPYFTDEQVQLLQIASERRGVKLDVVNGKDALKERGYTTTQMNLRFKDGSTGELQIKGNKINSLSELEHKIYDIWKGKTTNPNDPIVQIVRSLDRKQYEKLQTYISNEYRYKRSLERKRPVNPPAFPKELDIRLKALLQDTTGTSTYAS